MSETQLTGRSQGPTARGQCLCGSVRFEVHGPLRPVIYCHCTQCRRSSGHFAAATACAAEHLRLISAESLRWYASSALARRGFCATCGSPLFWERLRSERISIWAGTLDTPTGLTASSHIYMADKGDYYGISDGLPRWPAESSQS